MTGDDTPPERVVLAPWSPLGQVGSVKVAWVQQYALKMPPATPCTLMLDCDWGREEMTTCCY